MHNRLDTHEDFPQGMKEYLSQYGWHFSKKMCEFAVSRMEREDANGKKTRIQPYNKEQVEAILKQYGVELKRKEGYDCVFVANMGKSDYLGSSIPNEQYLAKYIKDVIDDPDGYDGLPFTRYFADTIGSGTPIIWEDML